jgi:hypothetical protein
MKKNRSPNSRASVPLRTFKRMSHKIILYLPKNGMVYEFMRPRWGHETPDFLQFFELSL